MTHKPAHPAQVMLAHGREGRALAGHPWVFATEVSSVKGDFAPGDIVDVLTARGRFVGRGYINPASQILVRFLTRRADEPVNEDFWRSRVREALEYRIRLLASAGAAERPAAPTDLAARAFRLVFAEADHIPAFIADYFAGYVVFQTLALGVDVVKGLLIDLVREEATRLGLPIKGFYERNDAPVRELEGLPLVKGPFAGAAGRPGGGDGKVPSRVTVLENDARIIVDIAEGQKTGYFLDQRENRAAIAPYVRSAVTASGGAPPPGARVLDCFCYTGGFAVAAGLAGAREVTAVDSSAEALALVAENATLNGLADRVITVEANVFDFLRAADAENRTWDVVLLDPPAFAKNKAALSGATRGYKEINLRAMKLLPPGGYLITSSCSQHVSEDLFLDIIASAAADCRRRVRVVEVRSQAKDHPFLPAAPETRYLKFVVVRL